MIQGSDFEPGDKRLASQDFAREMAENSLSDHFAYVEIWRNDGTVIYSDAREIIGNKVEVTGNFRSTLDGQIVFEESAHGEKDHADVMIPEMKGQEVLVWLEYLRLTAS